MANKTLDMVADWLVVVGAVNWGLVGLADMDLVALLPGETVQMVVYVLVGAAGVWKLLKMLKVMK